MSGDERTDIEHLRAVGRAATEKPWSAGEDDTFSEAGSAITYADVEPGICAGGDPADAEFIATARNNWGALLDEVEALRGQVERVEEVVLGVENESLMGRRYPCVVPTEEIREALAALGGPR